MRLPMTGTGPERTLALPMASLPDSIRLANRAVRTNC